MARWETYCLRRHSVEQNLACGRARGGICRTHLNQPQITRRPHLGQRRLPKPSSGVMGCEHQGHFSGIFGTGKGSGHGIGFRIVDPLPSPGTKAAKPPVATWGHRPRVAFSGCACCTGASSIGYPSDHVILRPALPRCPRASRRFWYDRPPRLGRRSSRRVTGGRRGPAHARGGDHHEREAKGQKGAGAGLHARPHARPSRKPRGAGLLRARARPAGPGRPRGPNGVGRSRCREFAVFGVRCR
jgi:hypothetical protein